MPLIIEKPKTIIAPNLLKELQTFTSDQGQVIVHGICKTENEGTFIRIWPSTFLFDHHSSHVSELVHYERISGFPVWTEVKAHSTLGFTLVFTGLPSTCKVFDLQEVIPQSNGFYVPAIVRNEQDVYYLDFSG
jgi:hypothetical protein